jgi:hypothetical protein
MERENYVLFQSTVALGGVVDPRFAGSNPAEDDGF